MHAAAGGTGLILCQWAAALGATVIGTVSTEAKAELAHAHGCKHRTPERTVAIYQKLQKENIIVSLREGRIRVSPHLFNSEGDIHRLISAVAA